MDTTTLTMCAMGLSLLLSLSCVYHVATVIRNRSILNRVHLSYMFSILTAAMQGINTADINLNNVKTGAVAADPKTWLSINDMLKKYMHLWVLTLAAGIEASASGPLSIGYDIQIAGIEVDENNLPINYIVATAITIGTNVHIVNSWLPGNNLDYMHASLSESAKILDQTVNFLQIEKQPKHESA